jgi:hypothetical protein
MRYGEYRLRGQHIGSGASRCPSHVATTSFHSGSRQAPAISSRVVTTYKPHTQTTSSQGLRKARDRRLVQKMNRPLARPVEAVPTLSKHLQYSTDMHSKREQPSFWRAATHAQTLTGAALQLSSYHQKWHWHRSPVCPLPESSVTRQARRRRGQSGDRAPAVSSRAAPLGANRLGKTRCPPPPHAMALRPCVTLTQHGCGEAVTVMGLLVRVQSAAAVCRGRPSRAAPRAAGGLAGWLGWSWKSEVSM